MKNKSCLKKCRACNNLLYKIKYIRGEVTGKNLALFKCRGCCSYFTRIEWKLQKFYEFNCSSIDAYMNKFQVSKRVNDILSYSIVKNWLPKKNVNFLDIGCGVGWSLVEAKKKRFNTYGIEPVKVASKYGNNILKMNIINSSFQSKIFKKKKFDFIMMDQVLEHIPNPLKTIVDAFSLLKPGGLFFLAVPPLDWSRLLLSLSYQFPSSFIECLKNSRYFKKIILKAQKYDTFLYPEGHINYFSTQAISILAGRCNSQVIEQYHFDRKRLRYFPFLKLSTGSFFLRKNSV
jgi:2-polyprenyl-3-methyl-5-hydroxy-6-metoxy-1,4-benzoquinol methylase